MVWFIILAVVTGGLALGLPPDPQTLERLHISSIEYRAAVFVLLIPYIVICYAAFYAFAKLREYAHTIKGFNDGKAFRSIMIGTGVLAFGLVLPTIVSLITEHVAMQDHAFKPASVLLSSYLSLVAGLAAFLYINNGSHVLVRLVKNPAGLGGIRNVGLLFIALTVVFTSLVMHYQMSHANAYYLNTPLLVATFIIPNVFGWFMALLSAYEFGLYAKLAKGLLYRRALRFFSRGIVVAIVGSIAGQFVSNTFEDRVSRSLGSLLVVDYALLILVAMGLT